jgi:hypothetical protein
MTVLSDIRTLVRRDLKDTDAQSYRWDNDEIDRAIARALDELSHAIPLETADTIATADGSVEIDIASLEEIENVISIDRVEFPLDQLPRAYRRFKVNEAAQTITLIDGTEGDGEDCMVHYSLLHTLDGSGCTLPLRYHTLLALGASAYAAMSQSQYQADRANTGGENVDRDYGTWARDRLKEFHQGLRLHGRRGKVRQSRLYPETDHEGLDYE